MEVYKYIDIFTNAFIYIVNLLLRVQSSLRPHLRHVLKRNAQLKNLRHSDSCFIIGNGPSLNDVDLNLLKGKDAFCVNHFFKHPKDNYEPRFFLAIDQGFLAGNNREYIKNLRNKYPGMIMLLKYDFANLKDIEWDVGKTFFLYSKQFQYGNFIRCDCTKNMTACINVVLQCIQVAMYMGYKKIYLLGCDFNTTFQKVEMHYYGANDDETGETLNGNHARWDSLAFFHHYALQHKAKEKGIEIINLTKGSFIDAYPTGILENVLNLEE